MKGKSTRGKNRGSETAANSSIMKRMKESGRKKTDANNIVSDTPTLKIHIGKVSVKTNKEPIVHEKSVLDQLKVLIDKNKKLTEESHE